VLRAFSEFERAKIIERTTRGLRPTHHEDFVDASIRQFCATAKARLQGCSDLDANRQFLVDHIERVTYNRYHVAIAGSIPIRTESEESKLPFRIKGKIDIVAIRSNSCRKAALAAMWSTESPADTFSQLFPSYHDEDFHKLAGR
jgi:hypothetical protein